MHLLVSLPACVIFSVAYGCIVDDTNIHQNDLIDMDVQMGTANKKYYKWNKDENNSVVLPFIMKRINPEGENLEKDDELVFQQAMDYISSLSCIKFKERTVEDMFFRFERISSTSNHASVEHKSDGSIVLQTFLKLKPFVHRSVIVHELLHVLGIHHTQKRMDRDNYITVYEDNIWQNMTFQWEKCKTCENYNTKYDCMSIMHYRQSSTNPLEMKVKAKDESTCDLLTWPEFMSWSDIDLLNLHYQCPQDELPFFVPGNGYLTSHPDFPAPYKSGFMNRQILQVEKGNRISLEWEIFALYSNWDYCRSYKQCGWVKIVDGDGTVLMDKTYKTPSNIISKSHRLYIEFMAKTNYDGQIGFSLHWKELKDRDNENSGTIQSPNFPDNYNNNDETNETIKVEEGKKIKISFNAFDIEDNSSCAFDSISIIDGNGEYLLRTCGSPNHIPDDVISKTNVVVVNFKTDGSVSKSGFNLSWTAVEDKN